MTIERRSVRGSKRIAPPCQLEPAWLSRGIGRAKKQTINIAAAENSALAVFARAPSGLAFGKPKGRLLRQKAQSPTSNFPTR